MSLSNGDITHLLLAFVLLLTAAMGAVDMARRAIDTFERDSLGRRVETGTPDEGIGLVRAALG